MEHFKLMGKLNEEEINIVMDGISEALNVMLPACKADPEMAAAFKALWTSEAILVDAVRGEL
jgi:hypothetical protein